MSQLPDFGATHADPLAVKLSSIDQLVEVFKNTEKKPGEELLGIEYEMFAHDRLAKHPLAYEGHTSIISLFTKLISQGYQPIIEHGHIVALRGSEAVIALEPGGQIEIAAHPQKNLMAVNSIFLTVAKELNQAAQSLNIDLFALGVHPLAKRGDMAQVKKTRYEIMRSYMQAQNGLGLDMMTRSCAIQINLDFVSEADMVAKTQLAAKLMPFLSVLCSSSAFIEGKPSPYAMPRGRIWQKTDQARTGIPAMIFTKNFGYEAWINWVLDIPMYFIRRGAEYTNVAGSSFREFMAHGLAGHKATVRDFVDHLSTAFTEVRLKPILELRSPDSLPVVYVQALSTLSWALLYQAKAFRRAQELLAELDHQALVNLRTSIIEKGRHNKINGRPVLSIAGDLLDIARAELGEQSAYLKPFDNLVAHNCTVAEYLTKEYQEINNHNLPELIKKLAVLQKALI